MRFLAGTVDRDGYRFVITGRASPAIEGLIYLVRKASPDRCDWGPNSSDDAIGFLVELVMKQVLLMDKPELRKPLMEYFREKTRSNKMWLVTHESLHKQVMESIDFSSMRKV